MLIQTEKPLKIQIQMFRQHKKDFSKEHDIKNQKGHPQRMVFLIVAVEL